MEVNEDGTIDALTLGRTASFYYLKHESMRVLSQGLRADMTVPEVCSRPRDITRCVAGRPSPAPSWHAINQQHATIVLCDVPSWRCLRCASVHGELRTCVATRLHRSVLEASRHASCLHHAEDWPCDRVCA